MQTRSNEQLCALAQKGEPAARDLLLKNNLGFICKIANELYQSMNLSQSNLCLDQDDLIQEGSIGLLNAVTCFDDSRGMKFLTYAAPAIRNAMIDFVRAEISQFEIKISEKDGLAFQIIRLEDILNEEEQMQRIEAIAHPFVLSPEEIYIKKEEVWELYQAVRKFLYPFVPMMCCCSDCPHIGQSFSPERQKYSTHQRNVLCFWLSSSPQRYNTIDFP